MYGYPKPKVVRKLQGQKGPKDPWDFSPSTTDMGAGMNYGSGVRNPVGKIRSWATIGSSSQDKDVSKPPRGLA
jgi:hypothetical protein